MKTVNHFQKALEWIDKYSISDAGISVSSKSLKPYPEVSGYYIPTLLEWNEVERAILYGRWLVDCQHDDGSWGDPNLNHSYAFDTGQIIKGLLALSTYTKSDEWDSSIRNACNWLLSKISEKGEPIVPDKLAWGDEVPLGVLLYSYEAVKRSAEYFGEKEWLIKVDKLVNWFLLQDGLTDFTHLSHFHAYILEALCDLGLHERARKAMDVVATYQNKNGAVPGFSNVNWVCSTGLFQYAIVWYKLGDNDKADAAFEYATKLQNRSGGWYGSYGWFKKYFPNAEISWAVKYFLDALRLRLIASFESMAPIFSEYISKDDGRYELLKLEIFSANPKKVLDVGCGKGRYLRNLLVDFPHVNFSGADLSVDVMKTIPQQISLEQGSLLHLPYKDKSFDFIYTVEALEHAVHVDGALRELMRVLVDGGTLLILDKNIAKLGSMKLPDWEQWFDSKILKEKLLDLGFDVRVFENVPYEGRADGLFTAWVAKKLS